MGDHRLPSPPSEAEIRRDRRRSFLSADISRTHSDERARLREPPFRVRGRAGVAGRSGETRVAERAARGEPSAPERGPINDTCKVLGDGDARAWAGGRAPCRESCVALSSAGSRSAIIVHIHMMLKCSHNRSRAPHMHMLLNLCRNPTLSALLHNVHVHTHAARHRDDHAAHPAYRSSARPGAHGEGGRDNHLRWPCLGERSHLLARRQLL